MQIRTDLALESSGNRHAPGVIHRTRMLGRVEETAVIIQTEEASWKSRQANIGRCVIRS